MTARSTTPNPRHDVSLFAVGLTLDGGAPRDRLPPDVAALVPLVSERRGRTARILVLCSASGWAEAAAKVVGALDQSRSLVAEVSISAPGGAPLYGEESAGSGREPPGASEL